MQRAVKSRCAMASGAGQGGVSVAGGSGCRQNRFWRHRQRHHGEKMDHDRADRSHSCPSCRKYRGSPTAFQRSLREWCGAVPPPRQVLDAAHSRRYQQISDARSDAATAVVECRKRRVSKNSTAHDQRAARRASRQFCGTQASSRRTRLPCLCCDDNAFEAISEQWSIANALFWKCSVLQQQTPKHPGKARLSCPGTPAA